MNETPSQTVGPFFAIGLPWPDGPYAVPEGTPGAVWLRGRVTDGAGEPVIDAMLETWQSGAEGRGFARCGFSSGVCRTIFGFAAVLRKGGGQWARRDDVCASERVDAREKRCSPVLLKSRVSLTFHGSTIMDIFLHKRCAFVKEGRKAEWWPTRHGRAQGGMLKAWTIGVRR